MQRLKIIAVKSDLFFAVIYRNMSMSMMFKGIRKVSQKVVPLFNGLRPYYVITCVTWGIFFDETSASLDCCIRG